ncbi:MAG: hypothetical protein P4K83_10675 [Terracidiphilus sp.]|nr:hypothetical protein [Terracidiphilus sp.]
MPTAHSRYSSPMQPSTESSPSTASFASLLAALAAPEPAQPTAWDADLADDVTTLSYESALRTHARYKPSPEPFASAFEPEPEPEPKPAPAPATANSHAAAAYVQPILPLKCASITLRMTEEECTQLRQRAAEAGMTVSAYLRSCTFEAEALRAQVREAVAALRSATAAPTVPVADPAPRRPSSWRTLLQRLFPPAQPIQHPARA